MFCNIPKAITERMHYLEAIDASQRQRGLPASQRLCQIPPETGKFIALLAATAPVGTYIEVGTSAGYSALWLALACLEVARKIKTFEVSEEKARLARETFNSAGVESIIQLIIGDARKYLQNEENVSFCFLDAEKEEYTDYYEKVIPNMVSGGILVSDNILSHRAILEPFVEKVMLDGRVDTIVLPIGKGELVCRKL